MKLSAFEQWIRDEAVPAGGVGPNESPRLWERHIFDSALFAAFVTDEDTVLDVGSGVGLPGIPVAVLRPDCQVTLLDRSGRRCELASRAVRVLAIDNVEVVQGDVTSYNGGHSVVISRASLPPEELLQVVRNRLPTVRTIVAAGSRIGPPELPDGWESIEIPPDVAGELVWVIRAWISSDTAG